MVHRCALLGLLALIYVASAAGLPPRFADPRQVAVQESEPLCSSCTWLVKSMKCELSDIDTQDEIVRTILKDVCPKLPNEVQDICGQLAPQLIPIGVMYLQSISSRELCADAALCGITAPASRVNHSLVQQNDLNCPMCKMVLIAIRQELRNPDSETALIEQAHEACARLPTDWQAPCIAYVDQLGDQVFEYIDNMDPSTICMNFGACPPVMQALRLPVPPLPPVLVAKAAALRMHAHELSAENDFCDTCKLVVTEAASILGNLDTQKQILEYAKEACSSLGPNLKDQCLNYVELYGPLVVNMIVQYLKPELCIDAGYCPKVVPSRLHTIYAA
ncbi:g6102 [Coccomyxa viridis]|uniref:G6102 protein n=1 Tax=Coccomyxa viridis TaxID=1274662 RepID=A0ABP1FZM7_9CHLO